MWWLINVFFFPSTIVVCGSVLPLRGSRPPGGHRQRLRFPQPQIQPAEEQQEHGLLQGQTHAERGETSVVHISSLCVFVSPHLRSSPQLTSQHPYAEVYVGQPHVWTVDIENSAEVERAIRSILSQKVNAERWEIILILFVCSSSDAPISPKFLLRVLIFTFYKDAQQQWFIFSQNISRWVNRIHQFLKAKDGIFHF